MMVDLYNNFVYECDNACYYTDEKLTMYARDKLNNKFHVYLAEMADKNRIYVIVYYSKGIGYPGKRIAETQTFDQAKEQINLIVKRIAESN